MCRSQAEGGARCASHTRPAYQEAHFGTPAWDEAAAAYASTPTGRMELLGSKAAAEEARDVASVVAFEHALAQGERIREKAELFRDELAAYTAPAPAVVVHAEPIPEYEPAVGLLAEDYYDNDSYNDSSDDSYDADDDSDSDFVGAGDWSPTMAGQRWSATDSAFTGCTPAMTANQFIDRVCENVGVTRSEFEAAAAEYLARNSVPIVGQVGVETRHFGFSGTGATPLSAGQLRSLLTSAASPQFTPEQVKEIALIARRRNGETAAVARAAQQSQQAAAGQAAAEEAPRPARRAPSWALPTVPDDPKELTRLADDADPKVREAVAAHANTPADVLERLSQVGQNAKVRAQAARNANLPLARLTALASDNLSTVRAGAARNESMPHEHLENLAEDANENVVGAVARNPSTHPGTYALLARDDRPGVRKHAARRKDMPADIEWALHTDSDAQVRGALAKNRTTSQRILTKLGRDSQQSVRAAAVKNPNFPPTMLYGRLSRDPAPGVRAAVAGNRNTAVGTLTRLSTDSDPWVRRNVAWNENAPAMLLLALSNDPDEDVRKAARREGAQEAA